MPTINPVASSQSPRLRDLPCLSGPDSVCVSWYISRFPIGDGAPSRCVTLSLHYNAAEGLRLVWRGTDHVWESRPTRAHPTNKAGDLGKSQVASVNGKQSNAERSATRFGGRSGKRVK